MRSTRDAWKHKHAKEFFRKRAKLYDEKYIPKGAEGLSRILIQKAAINEGNFVLDFATGTGFQAVQIALGVGSKGKVLGLDISEKMLREAEKKIKAPSLDDIIELRKIESEIIPLKDNSVNAAICGFAYHHFPDPHRVTNEIYRVLKPHGKLVVIDACRPSSLLKKFVADLSAKISDRTWRIRFFTEKEFRSFFEGSGFVDVNSWCFYQTHCLWYPFLIIEGTKQTLR